MVRLRHARIGRPSVPAGSVGQMGSGRGGARRGCGFHVTRAFHIADGHHPRSSHHRYLLPRRPNDPRRDGSAGTGSRHETRRQRLITHQGGAAPQGGTGYAAEEATDPAALGMPIMSRSHLSIATSLLVLACAAPSRETVDSAVVAPGDDSARAAFAKE